jgi:hypothetical protein
MLSSDLSAQFAQLGIDPATVELLIKVGVYLTIASIVAAIPTGLIARRKCRSVAGWVLFALCIPVLPLLLVWLLPGRKPPPA